MVQTRKKIEKSREEETFVIEALAPIDQKRQFRIDLICVSDKK